MSDAPEELRGIAGGLHHVAIVVRSLEASRPAWEALGLTCAEPEFVEDQDVNVLICSIAGQRIELVEPASDSSPVSSFLEKRGPGLHHLAFEVADCSAAIEAARARGHDLVFVDTAGRLHNKKNLMDELAKVCRVIEQQLGRGPDEVLLVLDATTGQNGLAQARAFTEVAKVTSVMLTKLDGSARGGIVFAIASELGLPVRFVGVGQEEGDLAPFDPASFVSALLAEPAPTDA